MTNRVVVLDGKNFDKFIGKGNVVVDFYADWCGPCKIMAPEFEKASSEIKDVDFGKVNVDKDSELAQRFQVMGIPTTIFFKDKEQVDRHTGLMTAEDIKERAGKVFG